MTVIMNKHIIKPPRGVGQQRSKAVIPDHGAETRSGFAGHDHVCGFCFGRFRVLKQLKEKKGCASG
jgi:hypothetical protein